MVSKLLIFLSAISIINVATGVSAPFITPCKASDTECAKQDAVAAIPLFADGIPDLGVETLDPVFFKLVDSSSPNLKFVLSDLTITGLKTCKPTIVRHDKSKSSFHVQLSCVLKLDGDYELDGNVLILSITGKGKIHVLLRKMLIDVDLEYIEKIGKDGETHLRIKKYKHNYDLLDKSDVVFEGLFAENEVLRKASEDLMKNNGNEVVKEIGVKMIEVALTKIVENCNNFLGKVPKKELVLD